MAKRGEHTARTAREQQPTKAQKLWPQPPTAEVIRGYKKDERSSSNVEGLVKLSDAMQKTPADIAGVGGTQTLFDMYPDVSGLWPEYHPFREGPRSLEIAREQKHMQQEKRREVYVAAVKQGLHERDLVTVTESFPATYTRSLDTMRKHSGLEKHARDMAEVINTIADGGSASDQILSSKGTNVLEHLKLQGISIDALRMVLHRLPIPGLQAMYELLMLQDAKPDDPQFVQKATQGIRKVFQDGREAMLREERNHLFVDARHKADLHDTGRLHTLERFGKRAGEAVLSLGVMTLVYEGLEKILDNLPETDRIPAEFREAAGIALGFVAQRLARAAGRAGVAALEMLTTRNPDHAKIAEMEMLLDLMHPMQTMEGHEDRIARHVMGQFSTSDQHKAEFVQFYRPVAEEVLFGALEQQDVQLIKRLKAQAFTQAEHEALVARVQAREQAAQADQAKKAGKRGKKR